MIIPYTVIYFLYLISLVYACSSRTTTEGRRSSPAPLIPSHGSRSDTRQKNDSDQSNISLPGTTQAETRIGSDSDSSCGENAQSSYYSYNFPEPKPDELGESYIIWSTYYYMPTVHARQDGETRAKDMQENPISDPISVEDYCRGAMQGSFYIVNLDGKKSLYKFAGKSSKKENCRPYFTDHKADWVAGNRFQRKDLSTPFSSGSYAKVLVPNRSIAVNPSEIPYGTVIYIKEARGKKVPRPNCGSVTHDGYFYASDTGTAMLEDPGIHIDVFAGTVDQPPFGFIKSSQAHTVQAFKVTNTRIQQALKTQHGL